MTGLALNAPGRATRLAAVDVRVKFAVLLSSSFFIFAWNSLALQAATLAAMVALALAFGVPVRTFTGLVKLMWPAFLLILAIQGAFSPFGQTPVWIIPDSVPWLGGRAFFRWEGLAFGLTVCCRLLIPLIGFAILFATSSPATIVLGLVRIGVPYRVAFLVSSTFRYVPLLLDELAAMRDAQRLRGIDIDAMGFVRKLIVTGRMLVPLIVASLRRAQQTEVALQARGFSVQPTRTYLDGGRAWLSPVEWIAIVFALALPLFAVATRIIWGVGGTVL